MAVVCGKIGQDDFGVAGKAQVARLVALVGEVDMADLCYRRGLR